MPKSIEEQISYLVNTSVDDAKVTLHHTTELAVVQGAIEREESCDEPRKSLLKLLRSAERRLSKVEVVSGTPEWDRARFILEGVKLASRAAIAGQVLLGLELQTLKSTLGFAGKGRPNNSAKLAQLNQEQLTWADWVSRELHIPVRTANRFIELSCAARKRFKKLGGNQASLQLLETPVYELDPNSRESLAKLVDRLTDGETQSSLLKELKIAQAPVDPPVPDNNNRTAKTPEETEEQLAFAMFTPVAMNLAEMRVNSNYQHFLYKLPMHGNPETNQPGLLRMRQELEMTLFEVKEAIRNREGSKAADVTSEESPSESRSPEVVDGSNAETW